MPRVVTYLRVSSEEQAQKDLSVPAQRKAIQKWIDDQADFEFLMEFADEGKSAYAPAHKRPGFSAMIQFCGLHQVDQILVHKLDRFSRNREEAVVFKGMLKKRGVTVRSVTEAHDPDTPHGFLYEGMMEVFSQYYSMNLATETIKGMRENAIRGGHNGGRNPYGYRLQKVMEGGRERGRLVPGPAEEVAVIKEIFRLYAHERWGVKRIVEELNRRKIPAPRTDSWGKSTVSNLIENPVYMGDTVWLHHRKEANVARALVPKDQRIRVEGTHEALVDRETWEKAREIAGDRSFERKAEAAVTYLLTGILKCGKCGGRYVGRAQKYGIDKIRYDYQCSTLLYKGKFVCDGLPVAAEWIESTVLDQVRRQLHSTGALQRLEELIQSRLHARRKNATQGQRTHKRQLVDIEQKIQHYYRAIGEGLDVATCKRFIEQLKVKQHELEAQGDRLRTDDQVDAVIARNLDNLRRLGETFNQGLNGLSPLLRRDLVKQFISRAEISDDVCKVVVKYPFDSDGLKALELISEVPDGADGNGGIYPGSCLIESRELGEPYPSM